MCRLPDHSRATHELKELPQEFHQKVDRACTASRFRPEVMMTKTNYTKNTEVACLF